MANVVAATPTPIPTSNKPIVRNGDMTASLVKWSLPRRAIIIRQAFCKIN
jgi:hypothetical protein